MFFEKDIPILGLALLDSNGRQDGARAKIAASPFRSERFDALIKSDVTALDGSPLMRNATRAFIESLRSGSAFAYIHENYSRHVPFRTPIACATSGFSGSVVQAGKPIPVSKMSLAGRSLVQRLAVALTAITSELVNGVSTTGVNFLNAEMSACISSALDSELVTVLDSACDSGSVFESSGPSTGDTQVDLRAALDGVNTSKGLVWIASSSVAKHYATLLAANGAFLFPSVSPTGGELLGLPFLVTDQATSGDLFLVDASAFFTAIGAMSLSVSSAAALQMNGTPTDGKTNLVSMFQTGSRALKCTLPFGLEIGRENAVAKVTGIAQ